MILAADPATIRFGLALGGPKDGKPYAWTITMPGTADLDRTLACAADTIRELCRSQNVELVAIEEPLTVVDREHSAATLVALMQLTGAIRAAARRSGCRVRLCPVATVRKYFLGHAYPDDPKLAVMNRCRMLQWQFTDDNSADAAATWCYAMSLAYPKWGPNAPSLLSSRGAAA